ncbi:MAG: hypothetical protein Rubg2KO_04690 [Rubricoccaceae bacterium]
MTARFHRVLALVVFSLFVCTASAQGPLTLPAQVNGQLTGSSERVELTLAGDVRPADRYTLTLNRGQRATVRMESTAFDPYLKIMRNGSVHSRNDDHEGSREVSQLTLSSPGNYTLWAGSFTAVTNTGPYELAVTVTDASASRSSSGQTLLSHEGGTTRGVLTDDDMDLLFSFPIAAIKSDLYQAQLRAGDVLTVILESSAFDTSLSLLRGNHIRTVDPPIIAFDGEVGSQRSQIRFRAPESGLYTIYAGTLSEDGRGRYSLEWRVE